MLPGDIIFFHIRGEKTLHGVYRVRSEAYFDTTPVWSDPLESFPYRFLFEPHPEYRYLCDYDASIEVHSLYEIIDKGEIRSLVTLEFERNIEARSVKKILMDDAEKIIRLLHRDFRWRHSPQRISFNPIYPSSVTLLKDKVFKVGNIENAVKGVLLYELAHNNQQLKEFLHLPDDHDFVNEFITAQTTRKALDIFISSNNKTHTITEVKTGVCDGKALKQALYYRDLLRQRNWMGKEDLIVVALVAQRFTSDVLRSVRAINKIQEPVKLIEYVPTINKTWARFRDVTSARSPY